MDIRETVSAFPIIGRIGVIDREDRAPFALTNMIRGKPFWVISIANIDNRAIEWGFSYVKRPKHKLAHLLSDLCSAQDLEVRQLLLNEGRPCIGTP